MFRQYQGQDAAGSQGRIRTISGVSQSSETMENVNGPPAEELAPSTVIELTVDSASSSAITPSPLEAADESGPASITVSNSLSRSEGEEKEEEQKLVQESSKDVSGDGNGAEAAVTHENSKEEEESNETNKQEPEPSTDNLQTSATNQAATDERDAVEVVGDSASSSESDATKMSPTNDEKSESDPSKGESPNSMTEDSLNNVDTEVPVVSEQKDRADQTSAKTEACLENSALGGASVFNEDLVDVSSASDQIQPSDADDSQEESSYASAVARGEGEEAEKEEGRHEEDEGKKSDLEGQDMMANKDKDEKQEVTIQEKTEETPLPASDTSSAGTPEQNVTEPPSEKVQDDQSSSINETTSAEQQPSDTTPLSTAQEAEAASTSASCSQTSETTSNTAEEAMSSPADTSTAASTSSTQKSDDTVSKAKDIKIARLDVSNVASDTERLELKETPAAVRVFCLFVFSVLSTFGRFMRN